MGIKILLADDSITIQKVIGIIFGGDDYSLTVVDNGKAALEKAREVLPDVLLIDALMPGMTGYEVCEVIRSTPALAAKPILLLTGSFEPFDEAKAKTCGADDFLAKPFESQQIVAKVRELFEKGSSRAAAAAPSQPTPAAEPFAAAEEFFAPPPVDPFDTTASNETAGAAAPDDIWGAFTATEPSVPATPPSNRETAPQSEIPDVFALINEEQGWEGVQPATPSEAPSQQTGSQWVPVEEQTFEFHEESIAAPGAIPDTAPSIAEVAFGEISFEEPATSTAAPAAAPFTEVPIFEEPASEPLSPDFGATAASAFAQPEPAPASAEPPAAAFAQTEPVPPTPSATAPLQLSEEQIKAAIAGLSKEVIERIVWEVVPDLAETLIKDAIRKIREGI